MLQAIIHYGLHFCAPVLAARLFVPGHWFRVSCILVVTMLVDFDHLLATPIFDAARCSINTHPLHSFPAIGLYFIGLLFPQTRLVAVGLLWHMVVDAQDCLW
jgi:hypothetical protein